MMFEIASFSSGKLTFCNIAIMPVKDYYAILEVEPGASAEDIKRSFRKLAIKYHPDTNQGNRHSEAWFKELQEAYNVLSDPQQKEDYLQERWLRKSQGKAFDMPMVLTPEHVLRKSEQLRRDVAGMDHFRMNHEALRLRIEELLQWQWLDMLKSFGDASTNERVLQNVLASCEPLAYQQIDRLKDSWQIAEDSLPEWKTDLQNYLKSRRSSFFWDQFQAPIIILISLLLCALIFLLSS